MSNVEIGLTVAVVVLAIALYFVWRDGCLTHARLFDGDSEICRMVQKVNNSVGENYDRLKEVRNVAHDARQIARQTEERQKEANGSEQKRDARLAAVEKRYDDFFSTDLLTADIGKVIADEVLTEPEFVDRVNSVPLKKVADLAYVDGGHAATDFDLTAPDADPETAEAQPQPDDDQATAVNDVQAVEEWDEAKRGEVA